MGRQQGTEAVRGPRVPVWQGHGMFAGCDGKFSEHAGHVAVRSLRSAGCDRRDVLLESQLPAAAGGRWMQRVDRSNMQRAPELRMGA